MLLKRPQLAGWIWLRPSLKSVTHIFIAEYALHWSNWNKTIFQFKLKWLFHFRNAISLNRPCMVTYFNRSSYAKFFITDNDIVHYLSAAKYWRQLATFCFVCLSLKRGTKAVFIQSTCQPGPWRQQQEYSPYFRLTREHRSQSSHPRPYFTYITNQHIGTDAVTSVLSRTDGNLLHLQYACMADHPGESEAGPSSDREEVMLSFCLM